MLDPAEKDNVKLMENREFKSKLQAIDITSLQFGPR